MLKKHGATGEAWSEWQAPCAVSAEKTFLSGSFALQRRPLRKMDSFKRQLAFLKEHRSVLTEAAPIDMAREAKEPYFVTLSRRVDDPGSSPAHMTLDNEEDLWHLFHLSYRDVLEAVSTLNSLRPDESLVTLKRGYIASAKVARTSYLNHLLKVRGYRLRLPDAPESEFVVSHGDPLLKNVVRNKQSGRYLLIDWGELGFYPRYSDPAHAFGWMLMRTEVAAWDERLHEYLPEFAEVMHLEAGAARQAVLESLTRDLVLYQDRTWLERLEDSVSLRLGNCEV